MISCATTGFLNDKADFPLPSPWLWRPSRHCWLESLAGIVGTFAADAAGSPNFRMAMTSPRRTFLAEAREPSQISCYKMDLLKLLKPQKATDTLHHVTSRFRGNHLQQIRDKVRASLQQMHHLMHQKSTEEKKRAPATKAANLARLKCCQGLPRGFPNGYRKSFGPGGFRTLPWGCSHGWRKRLVPVGIRTTKVGHDWWLSG